MEPAQARRHLKPLSIAPAATSPATHLDPADVFKQRLDPLVAVLALALYFIPSVILAITTLMSCTTLQAWSGGGAFDEELHMRLGTIHRQSNTLLTSWMSKSRLVGSMGDECWTGRHADWAVPLVVIGVVMVVLVAAVACIVLWQLRGSLGHTTTLRRYGVLYAHLRPNRWWWIIFDLARRVYVPVLMGLYGAGQVGETQGAAAWVLVLDAMWLYGLVMARPERHSRVHLQYVQCVISQSMLVLLLLVNSAWDEGSVDQDDSKSGVRTALMSAAITGLHVAFYLTCCGILGLAFIPKIAARMKRLRLWFMVR